MADLMKLTLVEVDKVVRELIAESEEGILDPRTRMQITDELSRRCEVIGRIWDRTMGCDVTRGPERRYGTRNRKSMFYKLRKAVGFSYP